MIPGYRILRTIGKGGMGIAYLATQLDRNREVVLKLLRNPLGDGAADPQETLSSPSASSPRRLSNEAEVIAMLYHPNIVRVYESGEHNGMFYIAMEYLQGGDLAARIGTGMSVIEALDLAIAMASALGAAHAKRIVHRDVKPANILFRETGEPVLMDFGLAKHLENDPGLTSTGIIIGSPSYMSPEQINGDPLDGRTDIYSLGIIFYEMLTGTRPYEGKSMTAVLMKHVQAPIPDLPYHTSVFQSLLTKMMAKAPRDRFESAEALERHLRGYRQLIETNQLPVARDGRSAAAEDTFAQAIPDTLLQHLHAGIRDDLENDRLVLPSLPEVAIKIRRELERDRLSAARLTTLISVDPALSAQLLRVANSAFYAGTAPVKDLRSAVVRLGNKVVNHVVMMLVAGQLFHAHASKALKTKLREVWQHSLLVASLSEVIARRLTHLEPDVAMLAGLIHDIGLMPALEWAVGIPHLFKFPDRLDRFMCEAHPEIGALVLVKWNYPEDLIRVAREHEACDPATEDPLDYVHVVALASRLANELTGGDVQAVIDGGLRRIGTHLIESEALAALIEAGQAGAASLNAAIR